MSTEDQALTMRQRLDSAYERRPLDDKRFCWQWYRDAAVSAMLELADLHESLAKSNLAASSDADLKDQEVTG